MIRIPPFLSLVTLRHLVEPRNQSLLRFLSGTGGIGQEFRLTGRGHRLASIQKCRASVSGGIPFVAVSFGFSDQPAGELGADAVIDSYAELIEVLERLTA